MNIAVLGSGGHARVVIATARAAGLIPCAVYDDDPALQKHRFCGVEPGGPLSAVAARSAPAHVAIGSNRARQQIVERLTAVSWVSVIHPSAIVDASVILAPGVLIGMGAKLQAGAEVGSHTIVNTGAIVEHDCTVGDFCHLAPGSILAGGVRIEDGAMVGLGACILPGVRIGRNSIVGAGAVVHRDVPSDQVVVGIPARFLKVSP